MVPAVLVVSDQIHSQQPGVSGGVTLPGGCDRPGALSPSGSAPPAWGPPVQASCSGWGRQRGSPTWERGVSSGESPLRQRTKLARLLLTIST